MTKYNKHKKHLVDLNEGEEWCPKCKGVGVIKLPGITGWFNKTLICSECFGDGKIDWIEKATGKKPRILQYGESSTGPGRP